MSEENTDSFGDPRYQETWILTESGLVAPSARDQTGDGARYKLLTMLGRGGSGEVWRATDTRLQREVAIKLLRPGRALSDQLRQRFIAEAKLSGGLAHPGIISIFDSGFLDDDRPFFVMPVVNGRTLQALIRSAHVAGPPGMVALNELLLLLDGICGVLSYAHSKGVLHRDLKPNNVMVDAFGQPVVLDWGLASVRRGERLAASVLESVTTTADGKVEGTISYISPEQAHGLNSALDERADVFALGAILHEMLTNRPPWQGTAQEALAQARAGTPLRLPRGGGQPEALLNICERALAIDPDDRYPSAAALSVALRGWLTRQDDLLRARALAREARAMMADADTKRARAQILAQQAAALLAPIPANAPEEDKHPGWQMQDDARALEHDASLEETRSLQALYNALFLAPELPEAHEQLADRHHQEHRAAEAAGDPLAAARSAYLLREHDRGKYRTYLRGEGELTLLTSRPARVQLYTYTASHRRLRPQPLGEPLEAPVLRRRLPIGSYLAELRCSDGVVVRYPFSIQRCGHTNGAWSADHAPRPIWLPTAPEIPPGMQYVPAGPFWSGGDVRAFGAPLPLRRVWIDGFFMATFPVTNRDFIAFLDALVDAGMETEAEAFCPRERSASSASAGPSIYGRDARGHYQLVPDADGDIWNPAWPVLMLRFAAMSAFALWRSATTGFDHRLCYELEWEKAARGGDRRCYVWGDGFDPTWGRIALSSGRARNSPVPVSSYPVDSSPYGIRGMAGNSASICLDHYRPEGPTIIGGRWRPCTQETRLRAVRGGHWNAHPTRTRLCSRGGVSPNSRAILNGFRLTVPAPSAPGSPGGGSAQAARGGPGTPSSDGSSAA